MERPRILPLPGNSTREGNFYSEQTQSQSPEWPGAAEVGIDQNTNGAPTALDPLPFVITPTGGE